MQAHGSKLIAHSNKMIGPFELSAMSYQPGGKYFQKKCGKEPKKSNE